MCTNARSVCNNIPELNHMLSINDIYLSCITESWLINTITNAMTLPVDEFTIFRYDRGMGGCGLRGGGVCLITRNLPTITSHQISLPSKYAQVEIVCVDLIVNVSCGVRVIALYIPPRSIKVDATCSLIIEALELLS